MRRNRLALAAAAAVVLAILLGAGGIAWQARQTAIERDVALAEARRSEAISGMLTLMFRDAGDLGTGADATVKQLLDQTSRRMIETVAPGPRSTLLVTTIADLYVYVEDPASADALLRRALERNVDGGDPVSRAADPAAPRLHRGGDGSDERDRAAGRRRGPRVQRRPRAIPRSSFRK